MPSRQTCCRVRKWVYFVVIRGTMAVQAWVVGRCASPEVSVSYARITALVPGYPRAGREAHVVDAGHFALDEQPDMIADPTRRFLQRRQTHTDGLTDTRTRRCS